MRKRLRVVVVTFDHAAVARAYFGRRRRSFVTPVARVRMTRTTVSRSVARALARADVELTRELALALALVTSRASTVGVELRDERANAHPFVCAFAGDKSGGVIGAYVGERANALGARERANARDVRIVRSTARGVESIASSARAYVARALVEEAHARKGERGDVARACEAFAVSEPSVAKRAREVFAKNPSARIDAFLTTEVERFMDVDEMLIARHVGRGDEASALVAAEWHADGPYRGWARPHGVYAKTLEAYGRGAEARDRARIALSAGAWWTMGANGTLLDEMKTMSGYAGRSAEDARRTLDGADVAGVERGEAPLTKEALALKRAMATLDAVAWGEINGWMDSRERVAEALADAGLRQVSEFVLHGLREE